MAHNTEFYFRHYVQDIFGKFMIVETCAQVARSALSFAISAKLTMVVMYSWEANNGVAKAPVVTEHPSKMVAQMLMSIFQETR